MSLLLPPRFEDESSYGFIQRTLVCNYLSWNWLCSQIGLTYGVFPNALHLSGLTRWFGDTINKDDLLHVVGGRGVRTRYQIYGHEFLDRSQIGISVPKICPECLLVYGYKRKFWDIDFVSVCPEHRTRLVKECVKCQAPISWYSLEPSICRCGYIFENGRHVCTDEEISWALWLKQMFEPDLNFDGSQVLTNLRSHRLGVSIRLVRILGMNANVAGKAGKSVMSHLPVDVCASIITEGVKKFVSIANEHSSHGCEFSTHWQELAAERLLESTVSFDEVTFLEAVFAGALSDVKGIQRSGSKQLTLRFD